MDEHEGVQQLWNNKQTSLTHHNILRTCEKMLRGARLSEQLGFGLRCAVIWYHLETRAHTLNHTTATNVLFYSYLENVKQSKTFPLKAMPKETDTKGTKKLHCLSHPFFLHFLTRVLPFNCNTKLICATVLPEKKKSSQMVWNTYYRNYSLAHLAELQHTTQLSY